MSGMCIANLPVNYIAICFLMNHFYHITVKSPIISVKDLSYPILIIQLVVVNKTFVCSYATYYLYLKANVSNVVFTVLNVLFSKISRVKIYRNILRCPFCAQNFQLTSCHIFSNELAISVNCVISFYIEACMIFYNWCVSSWEIRY